MTTAQAKPASRFQVLALDGGGFKGLYAAGLLAKLEEALNIHIADHFDLIVGTSTGGILALGLGLGFRPRELVEFYSRHAPGIFRKPRYASIPVVRLLHGLSQPKYDSKVLEAALREKFGDRLLGDSKKRLVVPSFDLEQRRVHLFKTRHHERLVTDWKWPAWKVAVATSSAPIFFPVADCIEHLRLIDGGVWANNPTMVGVVEAVSLLGQPLDTIKVLSIGTSYEVSVPPNSLDRGGFRQWASKAAVIDVLMEGQNSGALGQAINLLGKDNVVRLNTNAPRGTFALDKMNEEQLLGRATADARHATRVFSENFLSHRAADFIPLPPPQGTALSTRSHTNTSEPAGVAGA